ncbi:MAG: phenylacetate--CoA ligase family protein [Candidatus Marinimicrobia bacterium]|nr:phenylacetate--CoA ligase family protein [Candidatus Neomarinimicrobiota bacterium]
MNKEKLAPKLLKFYKPNVIQYLNQTRELFSDQLALDHFQKKRLEKLLNHAYLNTKYYRKIFDEIGLFRGYQIVWEKFSDVPLLTKEKIRKHFHELTSADIKSRKSYRNTSGGSTGEPVIFLQDKEYFERMVADTIWFAEMYGKNLGAKEIKIWGSEKDIFHEKEKWINHLINYFFNRNIFNSFHLNEDLIVKYIHQIRTLKPVMIWSYVDSVYEISRYVLLHKIQVYCPKIIVCTAGTLYPEMRQVIAGAFPDTKILNQYGSREVGILGIGEEKIRIFQQSVFMEIFDKETRKYREGPGNGNIVVTALNNYSMPLIRFDIGDLGESDEVEAANVKSLCRLTGRENAHIYRRDGSKIHGELFTHLFYFLEAVTKFQVIQEDYAKFQINLEINSDQIDDKKIDILRQKINQIMEETCEIEIHIVNELPKLKSGKFQFVMTKVKHG